MGDNWGAIDIEGSEDVMNRARQMLEYVESQMERGRRIGVDFKEIVTLLQGARMMLDAENYDDAMELIAQASESAGELMLDFEMLAKEMKKAEATLGKAEENGKDTTEAKKLMKLAAYHKSQADYKIAIEYAKRVQNILTAKKEPEIAWGSGL